MKRSTFLFSVFALAVGACGAAPRSETGALSLPLTAVDSAGSTYRLRNATFTISGYPDGQFGFFGADGGTGNSRGPITQVVSTDSEPDASDITRKLLPGSYTIGLSGNWFLERSTPAGRERVARAALLSPTVQWTYVPDGGTARVTYQFGVDGDLIDFRNGDLGIDVQIVRPGERPGRRGLERHRRRLALRSVEPESSGAGAATLRRWAPRARHLVYTPAFHPRPLEAS